jgi:hypothetical protein
MSTFCLSFDRNDKKDTPTLYQKTTPNELLFLMFFSEVSSRGAGGYPLCPPQTDPTACLLLVAGCYDVRGRPLLKEREGGWLYYLRISCGLLLLRFHFFHNFVGPFTRETELCTLHYNLKN